MRKSGIELLRILAASAVVVLHYHEIASTNVGSRLNMLTLDMLESFAICAVNVFCVISGYFMIKTPKRTIGKALSLLFQVSLINSCFFIFSVATGNSFSWGGLFYNLVPHNYFVVLYVVMYIVSPYINSIISNLSDAGRKRFLLIAISLFSIWPTVVNVSGELFHVSWFGLNSIGAWGSQKGFTIVNFLLLYSIGACFRLDAFKVKRSGWLILACGLLIFLWGYLCDLTQWHSTKSAWEYHNPLVILLSVLLLDYFRGLDFQYKFINDLAKGAFFCYLIHWKILMHAKIDYFATQPICYMLLHILVLIIVCYIISWFAYLIYNIVFNKLFTKLDSVEIKY